MSNHVLVASTMLRISFTSYLDSASAVTQHMHHSQFINKSSPSNPPTPHFPVGATGAILAPFFPPPSPSHALSPIALHHPPYASSPLFSSPISPCSASLHYRICFSFFFPPPSTPSHPRTPLDIGRSVLPSRLKRGKVTKPSGNCRKVVILGCWFLFGAKSDSISNPAATSVRAEAAAPLALAPVRNQGRGQPPQIQGSAFIRKSAANAKCVLVVRPHFGDALLPQKSSGGSKA